MRLPYNQVWYEVSKTSAVTATGWIIARIEDKSYVSGGDPCQAIYPNNPSGNFSFTYDRLAARNYVIPQSYANNGSSPGAFRVTRFLNGVRFANFDYADLAGASESTGSAMFVSEGIWMGGMPMTIGAATSCKDVIDVEGGWRYCWKVMEGNVEVNRSSSTTWELHKRLGEYYTTATIPIPNSPSSNTILNPKGAQVTFSGTSHPSLDRLTFEDVNDFIGPVAQGGVNFPIDGAAFDQFARTQLGAIKSGDYLWINTSTPHGLLIIGWSTPIDCQTAMGGTQYAVSSFYESTALAGTNQVVPWVTDFTSLQSPVPRPFYCTRYDPDADPNTGFSAHEWYFYTLLDSISIPFNQLYVDQNWQW